MTPDELVAKYRNKGILIDTNLLVLLVTGMFRRQRISKFSRTRKYTPEDFDWLLALVSLFARRIVTPHIVAETDNLARQLSQSQSES